MMGKVWVLVHEVQIFYNNFSFLVLITASVQYHCVRTIKMGHEIPRASTGGVVGICKEDVGTKDEWISRDPELIRLTGRHPFNWYVLCCLHLLRLPGSLKVVPRGKTFSSEYISLLLF
jgi:hypothetical protein